MDVIDAMDVMGEMSGLLKARGYVRSGGRWLDAGGRDCGSGDVQGTADVLVREIDEITGSVDPESPEGEALFGWVTEACARVAS